MTTERTGKAFLAIPLVIFLVAPAKGRAADVILNRIEIQTLRYLQQQRKPAVLKSLSKVGYETLFGERGLGVESALVDSSGLWRWRGPHDAKLNQGEKGVASDAPFLSALLNRTAGAVEGTEIVIPKWVTQGMTFYQDVAIIWIGGGGRPQNVHNYKTMMDHGMMLWESPDSPKDGKDRDKRLIGDVLQVLPGDGNEILFIDKKHEEFTKEKLDRGRHQKEDVLSYFKDAKTVDPADLSQITLPSIYDFGSGQVSFPCSAKRIGSSAEIYMLPLEPGKKLWLKVNPDSGPKSEELQNADAAKLLAWMKDGKVEMCLQNMDVPMKVLPEQWERHIRVMESRVAPKK